MSLLTYLFEISELKDKSSHQSRQLSGNYLRILSGGVFSGLSSLITLLIIIGRMSTNYQLRNGYRYLGENLITLIDEGAFSDLTSLTTL